MTAEVGEYENYDSTSLNYDSGRQTVGLEEFLGAIALSVGGELNKARVLDVGCGTGNYVSAISPYVATVTGLEYNQGMLEQAKRKTVNHSNVTLLQGDATCLQLPSESFDAVICTQMIHHLPSTDGFLALSKFLSEAYRVLKKDNGVIVINTCSPEQSTKCWIGSGLAHNYIADRYPPIDTLRSALIKTGFVCQLISLNTYQRLLQSHVMLDSNGPLSKEWRGFHSAWSCISDKELMEAQNEWRKRQSDGTISQLYNERDEYIKSIGETTTIVARKNTPNELQ